MPFVHIDWVKGQSEARREEVARRISQSISEVTGIPSQNIWIVFRNVEADEWYVGPDSVAKSRSGASG